LRLLAKRPADRPESAQAVIAQLQAIENLISQPISRPDSPAAALAPAASSAAAAQRIRSASQPTPPAAGTPAPVPTIRGSTILLVEPSRSQAVIIRGYLQKLGYQDIPTVPSGEKALESARNAPPAVVISAMHLADMTGMQLAQKMRAENPGSSPGFVLITSQTDAQEANLSGLAVNTVRLHKPFDETQLATALAAAGVGAPLRRRVLVVDDSAAARVHIRSVLAGLELHHIVEAGDGAEAVAILEKDAFDLVVTDYNMPRLDGRGLLEFIRQRSSNPAVPVIVVTTETNPDKLAALRQLGVSAICDKSFPPEAVRAVVDKLR
jgi:two-component system chemotaxis response regulator CheY